MSDDTPAGNPVPPLVTADELDLSIVFPADRTLRLPTGKRNDDGTPETQAFRVRGRLTVDDMGDLLELEHALDESLAKRRNLRDEEPIDEDEVGELEREVIRVVMRANARLRTILRKANDDVPDELGLDEEAVMVAMSWLVGDVSVADAVAKALTAGVSGAKTEDEILVEARRRALEGEDEQAPLASAPSS